MSGEFSPAPWRAWACKSGTNDRLFDYMQIAAGENRAHIAKVLITTSTENDFNLMLASRAMADALDQIVRRLEMDICDGTRPDQWGMEDMVRAATAALPAGWRIGES